MYNQLYVLALHNNLLYNYPKLYYNLSIEIFLFIFYLAFFCTIMYYMYLVFFYTSLHLSYHRFQSINIQFTLKHLVYINLTYFVISYEHRHYMDEIMPIWRKTLSNQSINFDEFCNHLCALIYSPCNILCPTISPVISSVLWLTLGLYY